MGYNNFLSYLKSLQVDKHILKGRRGAEENVKHKIIVPLLQTLGWDLLDNMDFECMGADIVLFSENKPAIIIEVKSWEEVITNHLDQCLEYTFKLGTPWVIVSSGRETAFYCSLLNLQNLKNDEPLIRFSFDELLREDSHILLKRLATIIGKNSFMIGHRKLSNLVSAILKQKDMASAQIEFERKASEFKHEIKSKRITENDFLSYVMQHPDETKRALISINNKMLQLVKLNENLRLRYRSKEIGLEFQLRAHPRDKTIGLFGIYPENAHIAFGLEGWEKLNISKSTFEKLKNFPRKPQSPGWEESLITLLTNAIAEIR